MYGVLCMAIPSLKTIDQLTTIYIYSIYTAKLFGSPCGSPFGEVSMT